jgi:phosphoglycolate phosphatase
MPKLQGLIFDLDGTLVDSAPDLRQAMNRLLAELGRRPVSLEEMKSFCGDGMLAQMQRAMAATGAPVGNDEAYRLFQGFVKYYREQKADPSQIYPHVVETLEAYAAEGVKFGVCTNKTESSTLKLLDDLNLTRHFGFVAGGDTFMVHKPHHGHLQGVLEKLQVPASASVMVGDSVNDVRAAKGAGVPCVLVTQGYGDDLASLGADALIDGFNELRDAIGKLGF